MREFPISSSLKSYSQIIAQFLSDPCDTKNNKDLRSLEQYLELTINLEIVPNLPATLTPYPSTIQEVVEVDDVKINV